MNVKYLYGGTTLIVAIVLIIAMLGTMQNMLKQITANLEIKTPKTSAYCVRDSDCKQDPNDCTKCVNILSGGFTLISKCKDAPIKCRCVNNQCTAFQK